MINPPLEIHIDGLSLYAIYGSARGDEYTYIRYNTGEAKVTKKSRVSDGFRIIDLSAEAVEKLHEFLHLEQKDLTEE